VEVAVGFDVARDGWKAFFRPGTHLSFRELVAEADELQTTEAVGPRDQIVAAARKAIETTACPTRSKPAPPKGVFFGEPISAHGLHSVQLMLFRGFTVAIGREHMNGEWRALMKPGMFQAFDEFVTDPQPIFATKDVGPRDEVSETAQEEIVLFLLRHNHEIHDED
jgi:hypothetical protein